MNKYVMIVACAAVLTVGCKGGKQPAASENDSLAVDSVLAQEAQRDTTPMPQFLYYMNPSYMQTVYWTAVDEPQNSADVAEYFDAIHAEWALQEQGRRNAAAYTKMLMDDGKWVDIKWIDEMRKNPDGEVMYGGELHSIPSIPSPGMRYALVNPKDAPKKEWDYGEFHIIAHNDYLATRKQLKVSTSQGNKKMPQAVVKKLEQKYGMKTKTSLVCNVIDGHYQQGFIQFAGEYKNAPKDPNRDYKQALALEVIVNGDSLYVKEQLGYYEEETKTCSWNADDGGDFCPTSVLAAFQGPDGLELCYEHPAPESRTVGVWLLRDGQIIDHQYACYHSMIDEEMPLWKKDIAQLRKVFADSNPKANKGLKLTKYRLLDIDGDNIQEIWMHTDDDQHGAFFTFKDRRPQLIATEGGKMTPTFYNPVNKKGYLKIAGGAEGEQFTTRLYAVKGSLVVERFMMKELDGEITESELNGKSLTKWEAADYLDKTSSSTIDLYIYWKEIEPNN